jgi:hypothetical protein
MNIKRILKFMNIDKLTELTVEHRNAAEGVVVEEAEPHPLQVAFDSADFGCQTSAVKRIFEELAKLSGTLIDLKVKKDFSEPEIQPLTGDIVVLMGNENSHSYKEGEPILIVADYGGIQAMDTTGEIGNHPPRNDYGRLWRYATDEEMETFIAELKENDVVTA